MNYRVRPEVLASVLPSPFRPKIYEGWGIAGICMIRFKQLRPRLVPAALGMGSENAAHRIAVEWDQDGVTKEGVFIPRRDTNSWFNRTLGGRVFPGIFEQSRFETGDDGSRFHVHVLREDGETEILFRGHRSESLSAGSLFPSLEAASEFFLLGSTGYSATHDEGHYHGMELAALNWKVTPLEIDEVQSHFYGDVSRFPSGSVEVDCALVMENIEHEWHSRPDLFLSESGKFLTTLRGS